ncbi:MAG: AAA family ATPase [Verrucomicrobiota bacterium]
MAGRCQCLPVERIGDLLVPLGEGLIVRDLIARLDWEVIVVGCNRLGAINHTP